MKDTINAENTENIPSVIRHNLRNALTPAMMSADMLKNHTDPKVQRHAQNILQALEKTLEYLKKNQETP